MRINFKKLKIIVFICALICFFANCALTAAVNKVQDFAVESSDSFDIITISLSTAAKYNVSVLSNPGRLFLDIEDCEYPLNKKKLTVNTNFIKGMRGGQYRVKPVKISRIVLDLKKDINYSVESSGKDIFLEITEKVKPVSANKSASSPSKPEVKKSSASIAAGQSAKPVKSSPATVPGQVVSQAQKIESTAPVKGIAPAPSKKDAQSKKIIAPKKQTVSSKKPVSDKSSVRTSTKSVEPVISSSSLTVKSSSSPVVAKPDKKITSKKKKIQKNVPTAMHKQMVKQIKEKSVVKKPKEVKKEKKPVEQPVKEEKVVEAKPKSVPAPVPAQTKPKPAPAPVKDLVSLDFVEADIRDVLQVLAVKKGVNIISGDDVMGTVSLHLDNVPFDEAMQIILKMRGLVSQRVTSNIIRVMTPATLAKERSEAVQRTEVYRLNYSIAGEISSKVSSIMNAEGQRASVNSDDRTNSIIVTSTPEGIIAASKLIAQLDIKPEQVMIEAKIVEISIGDTKDFGIEWSMASGDAGAGNKSTIGLSETSSVDYGATADGARDPVNALSGGTGVSAPAQSTVGSFTFGYLKSNLLLTARLAAAQSKGKAKILSQPRISTLNNMEAKIVVGGQIPYTQTTIGSGGVSTQSTAFMTVGIQLTVKPTINADGRITMKINPTVSNVLRITAIGPETNTKEAETTVLVKDGETIVIGGLITQEERKDASQIPVLGDIPVLGHFFKSYHDDKQKAELLIFVTPYIIKE
ncbi:MAG: Type IV pilus biogenesis and competence protein PilQ precursor [Elusimicrobia bacterium ADurb.Bin231]|nr:MAG: Type IV pilus biogenesis and competence protein PilQ precursor [Elusimicrobia bacterium ADurb.Bin231]